MSVSCDLRLTSLKTDFINQAFSFKTALQSSEQLWRVLFADVFSDSGVLCIRCPGCSVHVNSLEDERIQSIANWRLKDTRLNSFRTETTPNLAISQVLLDHRLHYFDEQVVISED